MTDGSDEEGQLVSGGAPARLRVLAGAQEQVLDRVPEDRPRYTAMGAAVLGTAVLGALSMALAMSQVFDGLHWSMIFVVPFWGLFILNLDRWLVLTPMGTSSRDKIKLALPRLVIAAFFGIVIAEPLLLGIFNSAIEEEVVKTRQTENLDVESRLRACNPPPEDSPEAQQAAAGATCDGYRLAVEGDPRPQMAELENLEGQAEILRSSLQADQTKSAELNDLARRECTGDSGPGLTGVPGVAGECIRLRREADQFSASANIETRVADLQELDLRIATLNEIVGTSSGEFRSAVAQRIGEEVAIRQEKQAQIGLLERFEAFDKLRDENSYVAWASIFLRSFLVLVDCTPILLKVLTNRTMYDTMVERRRDRRRREFMAEEENAEHGRLNKLKAMERSLRADDAASQARAGAEERRRAAEESVRFRRLIDELREQIYEGASPAPSRTTSSSRPVPRDGGQHPANGAVRHPTAAVLRTE